MIFDPSSGLFYCWNKAQVDMVKNWWNFFGSGDTKVQATLCPSESQGYIRILIQKFYYECQYLASHSLIISLIYLSLMVLLARGVFVALFTKTFIIILILGNVIIHFASASMTSYVIISIF